MSDGHFTTPRAAHSSIICGRGDLVIANDAATLPASLQGEHVPSGACHRGAAGRPGARSTPMSVAHFSAVVFGAGDYRTRTEDRPPPPPLGPGDRLALGPLIGDGHRRARAPATCGFAFRRFTRSRSGPASRGMAGRSSTHISPRRWRSGTFGRDCRPPVAFEPPSAGFALDWRALASDARPRCSLRHHHARGRHLIDRRRGARPTAAVR